MLAADRLESHDGTDLAVYSGGNAAGRAVVFCGGLGGGVRIFQPLIDRLADRFRILAFDYRGLYASGPAGPAGYGMAAHVGDLIAVCGRAGAEAPLLVGWSMGVQLGLELHRRHDGLLRGFVALHGAPGRPLDSAFDSPWAARLAPAVLGAMRVVGGRFRHVGVPLARSDRVVAGFVGLGRRLGVMASSLDEAAFQQVGEEWTGLDLAAYAEIFAELGRHDASDLLARTRTPTLVVAGGRDRFTPLHRARGMVEAMPNAALRVIADATHFGLLEYPDAIADAVEEFALAGDALVAAQ